MTSSFALAQRAYQIEDAVIFGDSQISFSIPFNSDLRDMCPYTAKIVDKGCYRIEWGHKWEQSFEELDNFIPNNMWDCPNGRVWEKPYEGGGEEYLIAFKAQIITKDPNGEIPVGETVIIYGPSLTKYRE